MISRHLSSFCWCWPLRNNLQKGNRCSQAMEYRGWAFGHQSLYIKLLKWMNGWLLILISWKWKLLQYIKGTLTVQKSALGCIASPHLSDLPWNTSLQKSKIQNSYIYIFSSWSGKKLMLPWNWYIGKLHLELNNFEELIIIWCAS